VSGLELPDGHVEAHDDEILVELVDLTGRAAQVLRLGRVGEPDPVADGKARQGCVPAVPGDRVGPEVDGVDDRVERVVEVSGNDGAGECISVGDRQARGRCRLRFDRSSIADDHSDPLLSYYVTFHMERALSPMLFRANAHEPGRPGAALRLGSEEDDDEENPRAPPGAQLRDPARRPRHHLRQPDRADRQRRR